MPVEQQQTPRTDNLEAQQERIEVLIEKLDAKVEKVAAMAYESRAKEREQQIQIDSMCEDRAQLHNTIGRWVERIVFGFIAALGWFSDKLTGS